MFTVSTSFLIFLLVSVVLGIGVYLWVRGEKSSRPHQIPRPVSRVSHKCPICGNVYSAVPKDNMTVCPTCDSINPVEEEYLSDSDEEEEDHYE